jgi:hypothetical protein
MKLELELTNVAFHFKGVQVLSINKYNFIILKKKSLDEPYNFLSQVIVFDWL